MLEKCYGEDVFVKNNSCFDIKELEMKMIKKSLELEKKLALEELNKITALFTKDIIIFNGVLYKRIVKTKKVTIGRVTVSWERPIYEGSKKGQTVYYYPADDCFKAPKKTKQSLLAHIHSISVRGFSTLYISMLYNEGHLLFINKCVVSSALHRDRRSVCNRKYARNPGEEKIVNVFG